MAKLGIVKVRLDREVNGYILTCASTKEAVVVDPGLPVDKLEAAQKRYDFIIIDCPPSLDLIVINALVAADEVLVPLQAEFLALKGMQELLITMERVKRRLNPRLELIGILPTLYKSRALHSQEVLAAVKEKYGDKVYDFGVTDSIRFAETPLAGMSILQYAKESDGAKAYRALAAKVMENHRL